MKLFAGGATSALMFLPQAFAALTTAQLSTVFPGATNGTLSGSMKTVNKLAITVVTNSTHALFHLNSTTYAVEETGWMALGLGSKMANADFLMAWPMLSGTAVTWVLSHRLPSGSHGTPQLASTNSATDTEAFYTFLPELSTATTGSQFTTVAWLRALEPPSDYPTSSAVASTNIDRATSKLNLIYASASKDPASTDQNANVEQHNRPYGSLNMDIARGVNLDVAAPFAEEQQTNTSGGWSKRDKILIAHAVIGSVAAVLFVPAGILLARFGRSGSWFPAHRAIQLFSSILIVVAAIIGITQEESGHFMDTHTRLGIILLALFVVQPLLGIVAHLTKGGAPLTSAHPSFTRPMPSPVRLVHIVVGLAITGLAYWQVASGFDEWQAQSDRQTATPTAVKAVFWALLGVAVALYVVGWIVGFVSKKKDNETGRSDSGDGTLHEGSDQPYFMTARNKETTTF
ncbi:cytochrome and DOMON domain-containing protein [Sporobolomyces koalae]|uniref:cytochrome and DOMON domain-containing protein n=1 Tax=Sporobolomyces koalae TaxID=500713 RepID=UPI00316BDE77